MSDHYDFARVWNESLEQRTERPVDPREHVWASELGKAPVDIWLKMKGTPASNPPNYRSLRKFEAGNTFEWLVAVVLNRCGILSDAQRRCEHQYEGLLKVTGKLDFLMGCQPEGSPEHASEMAEALLQSIKVPEFFLRAGKTIAAELYKHGGIPRSVLEIKSTSAFMFDRYEAKRTASRNHRLQLFHYLKSTGLERGEVCYICRDDCRMLSIPVLNPSAAEDDYKWHIAEISDYWKQGQRPPLEKSLIWDSDTGKFAANWQVSYSSYLTMLYGFKDQAHFDDQFKPVASRWNSTMTRLKKIQDGETTPTGKPMALTDKNKAALDEIRAAGYDPDKLLADFAPEKEEEAI